MKTTRKILALILGLALWCTAAPVLAEGMTPGTHQQTSNGMNGPLTIEVTVSSDAIESVTVVEQMETPGIGELAVQQIADAIVEQQTPNVDSVSGATVTSSVTKYLVKECLKAAGADEALLNKKAEKEAQPDAEYTADVVIVGGGGAGLAASIRALEQGASVILIEKTDLLGGNSIVAGGFYNTPDPSRQDYGYQSERSAALETLITDALTEEPVSDAHKALQDEVRAEYEAYLATDKTLFDSPAWFALQTWNGGDKLASLDAVRTLADNAQAGLLWLEGLGEEFAEKVHHGGGALYPRSHQAVLPNGIGYINALTGALEGKENFTLLLHTNGKALLTEADRVVGVSAEGRDGNAVTLHANKGVVLTTGGFAGNVELRQKYCEGEKWPNLGADIRTTNVAGVTGDGIFMASDVGANLVNMDQLQMLPYCNPTTGFVNDCALNTIASVFINREGKRFVREDGRRDEMSKAILEQTDSMTFCVEKFVDDLSEAVTLAGQKIENLIENHVSGYGYVQNIAEAAAFMNVPEDVLRAELAEYDQHVTAQTADKFGTVSFTTTMDEGPFIIYERKPAAHHTMGGVEIDTQAHALRADGSIVEGLYCAGEITGVVHGANRIGGNAIVDFVVYGQIAGTNAAKGE